MFEALPNMNLVDVDDLFNASGKSTYPKSTYCFNYSVEGEMTVIARFIKSSGSSKQEAYKKAVAFLNKNNLPKKVTVYQKNYSDRCDDKWGVNSVPEDFSKASGSDDMPARNLLCRTRCNLKINKTKKAECILECDKNFPPSQKQEQNREEKEVRQDAREDKRDTKDELKELLKSGKISREEYNERMKTARDTKRDTVKTDGGGTPFSRAIRGIAKVSPIPAAGRGSALIAISKNMSGLATRLAPALVPEAEAQRLFTPEAIELAKKGYVRAEKAWKNLGGNEFKFKEAILKGYKAKPEKMPRSEKHSSVIGAAVTAAIISAAATIIAALISMIGRLGVKKNPYKNGLTPPDYTAGLNDGSVEETVPVEPDAPEVDPQTGKWVDPQTGNEVDPNTGKEMILGMKPAFFWTSTGFLVVAVSFGIYAIVKK